MRLQDIALGRKDVLRLDPRILKVREGWNVRQETPELMEHIHFLEESISEHGVKEPLTVVVEGEDVYVENGHCRLRAVMNLISRGLEIESIPAWPEDKLANAGDQILMQITRNGGLPLTPSEKGEVFRRLVNYGWSEGSIAEKAGTTPATVARLLALSSAPESLKKMVREKKVSPTTVAKQIQREGPDKAAQTIQEASEGVKKVKPSSLSSKPPTPLQHDSRYGIMKDFLIKAADAALSSRVELDEVMDEIIEWLEAEGMR